MSGTHTCKQVALAHVYDRHTYMATHTHAYEGHAYTYMYMRGTYALTRAAHIHVYVYILVKIVLNKYTDAIIWSKKSYICTNCAEHTHKQDISSGRASRWQIMLEKSQTRPNPAAGAICPKIHRWHCDSRSRVGGRLRPRAAFGAADSHRRHHCCICGKVDVTKKTGKNSSMTLQQNV